MTNSLINIAQVLAERVGEKSPTQLSDMLVDNGTKKQLNYENNGNVVVDEFKNNILNKFSTLVQQLTPTQE
jgi:hypothetical protein